MVSEPNWPEPDAVSNINKVEFLKKVELAKEHVRKGDVFQVVISQRFDHPPADAWMFTGRSGLNPSPYMYLIRCARSGRAVRDRRKLSGGTCESDGNERCHAPDRRFSA